MGKETAGLDLGEIHIAAVATTRRQALIISGRLLRSCKRLRNKRHGAYSSLLAHCTAGSRRTRQLRRRKWQASAVLARQQRDILHQASRKVVTYCQEEGAGRIFVGDVRDVQDGIRHGANNQKIAQWPHGQFYGYLTDKARRIGIQVAYIAEDGSTVTCSACGQRQMSAPRRRTARCTGCGTLHHRRRKWRRKHLLARLLWTIWPRRRRAHHAPASDCRWAIPHPSHPNCRSTTIELSDAEGCIPAGKLA